MLISNDNLKSCEVSNRPTYVGLIHMNVKWQSAPKADIMMIESLFQKNICVSWAARRSGWESVIGIWKESRLQGRCDTSSRLAFFYLTKISTTNKQSQTHYMLYVWRIRRRCDTSPRIFSVKQIFFCGTTKHQSLAKHSKHRQYYEEK